MPSSNVSLITLKSTLEYSEIKTDHTVSKYTSETDRTVRNSNKCNFLISGFKDLAETFTTT